MGYISDPVLASMGVAFKKAYNISSNNESNKYNSLILNNDPYKQIDNYKRRLSLIGEEIPEREQRGLANALMTALDILDRPGNAIRVGLSNLSYGDSFLEGFKRGFTGQEKVYGSDLLDASGVTNKYARGIGGFVLDVLLDPLTYVTGGTAAGLKSGFAKGMTMSGIGGSAFKRSMATYLPEYAGKSSQELLKDTARILGRGSTPLDPAVESVEQRILRRGWDEVNPDLINEQRALMRIDLENVKDDIVNANRFLGSSMGKYLPGLSKEINKKGLDVRQFSDLMESITEAAGRTRTSMSTADKTRMFLDLFPDTPEGVRSATQALMNLGEDFNHLPDGTLRLAKLFQDTFSFEAEKALSTGQRIYGKLVTRTGEVRDLSGLTEKYAAVMEKRATARGIEDAIKFANGLEVVYNKTVNATYLKFMGKPFLNVTDTIVRGADLLTTSLATSKFVQNTKIGRGLYNAGDALAYAFNTEHRTKRVLADKREVTIDGKKTTKGQLRYEGTGTFTKLVSSHVRKETALAQKAKQIAETAFAPIINNTKLRRATIIAVEGMAEQADKYAKALWEKEAAKLSREELALVHEMVARNKLYVNALFEADMSSIERRMIELGQKGEEGVGKLKYTERDNYVYHLYEDNFGFKVEEKLLPQTERERLLSSQSPSRTPMHSRQFRSLAEAEELTKGELKPVYDIVSSFAARVYETQKAIIQNEFITDIEYMLKNPDQFPGIREVISKTKRQDMVQLPEAFSNYYGTPELRQQMMRLLEEPHTNAGAAYFKEVFDRFTNMIKTLQTSLNPAFLLRNIVGETMMNWFANVGIEAHEKAAQVMLDSAKSSVVRIGDSYFLNGVPLIRKRIVDGDTVIEVGKAYKHANLSPEAIRIIQDSVADDKTWSNAFKPSDIGWINPQEPFEVHVKDVLSGLGIPTYTINGKTYTAYEIMEMFYAQGLGWSGMTKGNLVENMQDLVRAKALHNRAVEFTRGVGDTTETFTRLAHFIDRLDNGLDIKTAAQDVRKYHVDYRDLTTLEKNTFRRIAPYYTYMRKNTPIQLRQLILNPGKFEIIHHLVQESYNNIMKYDPDRPTGIEPTTPDYLKETLAIPWDIDNNGNIRYLNWNLPIVDIARLQFNVRDLMEQNIVDMLHPIIKTPIEIYMNKSMGTDAALTRYPGETTPLMSGWEEGPQTSKLADYMLSQLGVVNTMRTSGGQILARLTGQPEDPGKPFVGLPVALTLTKSLFPLINSQYAANAQAYQYRDQLQDYVQMLQNERGVYVPPLNRLNSPEVSARIMAQLLTRW